MKVFVAGYFNVMNKGYIFYPDKARHMKVARELLYKLTEHVSSRDRYAFISLNPDGEVSSYAGVGRFDENGMDDSGRYGLTCSVMIQLAPEDGEDSWLDACVKRCLPQIEKCLGKAIDDLFLARKEPYKLTNRVNQIFQIIENDIDYMFAVDKELEISTKLVDSKKSTYRNNMEYINDKNRDDVKGNLPQSLNYFEPDAKQTAGVYQEEKNEIDIYKKTLEIAEMVFNNNLKLKSIEDDIQNIRKYNRFLMRFSIINTILLALIIIIISINRIK